MSGQVAVDRRFDGAGFESGPAPAQGLLPLVVDFDAALRSDGMSFELALCALRARPAALPALAVAAFSGRAALELAVCAVPGIDTAEIPLDREVRAAIRQAQAEKRPVVLLTAGHAALAQALSAASGLERPIVLGALGGDAGDLVSLAAVRARCPSGFVVARSDAAAAWARPARAHALAEAAEPREARPSGPKLWAKALRLHQWAKNGLVFVPHVLAGQALDPVSWLLAFAAFLSFGLAASATYLLNDLHDLPHDRAHRSKRDRPLASGALPIGHALAAACLGLIGGLALSASVGAAAMATVCAYLAMTLAYTFAIKRQMIVDTATLGALFTLRLVAGIAFCAVPGSTWLLAFSMFVFTSLALGKRFVEIDALARAGLSRVAGRGYTAQDGPAVLALGAATSTAAVLILSLYIVEVSARNAFYLHPELLWAAPLALFLWLGRIWMLCGRGELRDDPVEFALTDRTSHALGAVIALSFVLACLRV